MEILRLIFKAIEGILMGAGLMAFIIFGRWHYCLSGYIKEQKLDPEE